jgi:hypothetical protein
MAATTGASEPELVALPVTVGAGVSETNPDEYGAARTIKS